MFMGCAIFQQKEAGKWHSTIVLPTGKTRPGENGEKVQTALAWTNRKVQKLMEQDHRIRGAHPESREVNEWQKLTLEALGWSGKQVR